MTLQQLRYITVIDEYRHFGKAAEASNLTQSTLSLMVKKLEEELDVKIFDREAHPVTPTDVGRKIIDQAKVVLYNANQISEMTRSEKTTLSGLLKVSLISTVAPVLVPGLFKYFGENYPAISLRVEEMLTDTIKDKLRKAEVDIGIFPGPVREPGLMEIPLYHERFYAYISPRHPAFARENVRLDSLAGEPIWMIKDGLRLMDTSDIKQGEEVSYEKFFEGGRVGTLIQIVNDNGGMTIIPETHIGLIMYSQQKGLRPIIEPELSRTVSMVIRSDYIHEAKLNAIVKAIGSIIPAEMQESIVRKGHLKL